jgi:hypothetical protein
MIKMVKNVITIKLVNQFKRIPPNVLLLDNDLLHNGFNKKACRPVPCKNFVYRLSPIEGDYCPLALPRFSKRLIPAAYKCRSGLSC